jgi:hypothetical protein
MVGANQEGISMLSVLKAEHSICIVGGYMIMYTSSQRMKKVTAQEPNRCEVVSQILIAASFALKMDETSRIISSSVTH